MLDKNLKVAICDIKRGEWLLFGAKNPVSGMFCEQKQMDTAPETIITVKKDSALLVYNITRFGDLLKVSK